MSTVTAAGGSRRAKARKRSADSTDDLVCPSCGQTNRAQARYCQECGRSLTSGGWTNAPTLTVLGAAVAVLVAIGALFASVIDIGPPSGTDPATTATTRTAPTGTGQPPDLSTMTPREAAVRLFNRVMMADEQGNSAEISQFAPMAIAAYDQLDVLDLEAIYHVGAIHAATGNSEGAEEAIERLREAVPDHLLASILEHRLAMDAGDQARAERAIERFRAGYDEEINVDRSEYRDHVRSIDHFRDQIVAPSQDGE